MTETSSPDQSDNTAEHPLAVSLDGALNLPGVPEAMEWIKEQGHFFIHEGEDAKSITISIGGRIIGEMHVVSLGHVFLAITQCRRPVLLDFGKVDFMSSLLLDQLIIFHNHARVLMLNTRGSSKIQNDDCRPIAAFKITELSRLFEIIDGDESHAREYLHTAPRRTQEMQDPSRALTLLTERFYEYFESPKQMKQRLALEKERSLVADSFYTVCSD
jgi:anti-anti-sigma regulatory factor